MCDGVIPKKPLIDGVSSDHQESSEMADTEDGRGAFGVFYREVDQVQREERRAEIMNGHAMYAQVQQISENSIVNDHVTLVKRIAFHLVGRMPPNVQVDDLIQAGMLGLLEASKNYSNSHGASFETFAGIRIRGAMLDEVRRLDWTPRSVHRKSREVSQAIKDIENETGLDAKDTDVARRLGLNLGEYHHILTDSTCSKVFSIDTMDEEDNVVIKTEDDNLSPYDSASQDSFHKALSEVIETLPDREQMVMALYYDEELNLREIGSVMDISESRVCQIHGQALLRVKARMSDWTQ